MCDDKSKVFDLVHPARRQFLKRLLAGAAFAVPVISTFTVDSLTVDTVHAMGGSNITNISNQVCRGDVGYVGPRSFEAHVSTGAIFNDDDYRVNGQVVLRAYTDGGPIAYYLEGEVFIVPGASVQSVFISTYGRTAAEVSTNGQFTILPKDLDTRVMCDIDELMDAIAAGNATCTVTGEYYDRRYSATGQIYAAEARG